MKYLMFLFSLILFLISFSFGEELKKINQSELNIQWGTFIKDMNTTMTKMLKNMEAIKHTGNPDIDFIAMMIPHHEAAIEMARHALIYGKDPLVRKLAEDIIATQQIEIETMKSRLLILQKKPDPDPDGFPAIEGTRSNNYK